MRDYEHMEQNSNSKIKVMRIIARMNVGGPAVQVSGLMRSLNKNDFDHRLFTGDCSASEADYLETTGAEFEYIKVRGLGRKISFFGDLRAFLRLIRHIRNFQPDIIHTHTSKAGVIGRLASIFSGVDSIRIHTFHGHLLYGYFGKAKRYGVVLIEKIISHKTHYLLAVGAKVRNDLLEVKIGRPEKFGVMPPGLQLNFLPEQQVARKALEINTSGIVGAFIGRVTQIKRPDRFLDVVEKLSDRNISVAFVVAGEGDLFSETQNRASESKLPIQFLGWQSNIEQVLAAVDFVILTSDNEGMPLSLIQAGMASRPVVATNVGSVQEVVEDGYTGIITSTSVNEIALAVESLVLDKGEMVRLGENARKVTKEEFSLERLVLDHENLYRRLLVNRAIF
jgi:glycosyltransferase involved in cell wall biosynthesis